MNRGDLEAQLAPAPMDECRTELKVCAVVFVRVRSRSRLLLTSACVQKHTRYSRQNGVHASPTVAVNGIVDANIQSSWSLDQWRALLITK